ncbi:MAG TPA: hypothetical protein DCG85_00935 [Lachnospiraceae bacterium]|nr:hypothetical protein [Lachnospiraceae bacterium]
MSVTADRISEVKGNMSQEEFAKSVNSSQSVISKILNGEQPSITLLTEISKTYRVSVDWLLGLSPRKPISGYSTFDEDSPTTYADVIGMFVRLLNKNSIFFKRIKNEKLNNMFYDGTEEKNVVLINDAFIGDLLFSVTSLMETNPETVDSWVKNIIENYDIPVVEWSDVHAITYSCSRSQKSSLEILRQLVEKKS